MNMLMIAFTKGHFPTNHCNIFLGISNSCKWYSPVSHRSPEMCTEIEGIKLVSGSSLQMKNILNSF